MPDLTKLPVPKYSALNPYHVEFDNIPIENLALRDELINGELENHAKILRDCSGNQGTLSNRLNQSIEENGSLKVSAINESLHNVASHTDGQIVVDETELNYYNNALNYYDVFNPVSFVRMLDAERTKLAFIDSQATNIRFGIETPSNTIAIDQGKLVLLSSDSIEWDVQGPASPSNTINIKPVLSVSTEFAHRHYYDIEPITENYLTYKTTSVNTPYVEGSLRVFVNGIRLSSSNQVYVPGNLVTEEWTLNSFTPNHTAGTFDLNVAISVDDIIRIDFDVSLT